MHALKQEMRMLDRLKKRSDFLRVAQSGKKWVSKSLILQVIETEIDRPRFGLTVSKRVSKRAVKRNRVKRRLRAAVYDIFPFHARDKADYVLIGRPGTEDRSYDDLKNDLKWCLKRLEFEKER